MPKVKEFDCVEMKQQIQDKIEEEHQGMTEEEIREHEEKAIKESPILGPYYQEITRKEGERS